MPKLEAQVANEIVLNQPPGDLAASLKKQLTINNPEYINALKFGRSVRGLSKYIRSYNERNGSLCLPRGFLDSFFKTCYKFGYDLDIDWQTVSFEPRSPSSIALRDWQRPWVDELLKYHQGVGVAPPGAGKTVAALEIYARLGQPCLWLTHTVGLARQVSKRLKEFLGEDAGIIGDNKVDIKHFTVGLIPTLVRRDLTEYKKVFGLVMLDEAHHCPARTYTEVVCSFPARYRYGLTATPYRDDGLQDLIFHVLGPIRCSIDKRLLRENGTLVTPQIIRRPTKFYFPYNSMSRKYNYKALEDALSEDSARNRQIVSDVVIESTKDERNICIILVGRIEHGEILKSMLLEQISNVGLVHSKQKPKESQAVMDAFERGEIRVLIATYKMLAEGFDYPPTNGLFLTAPRKGRSLIEQGIGRAERASEGKSGAVVFDYVDELVGVLRNQAEERLDIYEANENPVVTIDI